MRQYILQTRKLARKLEHSITYTPYPNPTVHETFYTLPEGTTALKDSRLANDAILEKLVENNIALLKALPLSSLVKTEINLH